MILVWLVEKPLNGTQIMTSEQLKKWFDKLPSRILKYPSQAGRQETAKIVTWEDINNLAQWIYDGTSGPEKEE